MAIRPEVLHECLKTDLLSQGLPFDGSFWPGMTHREAFASSLVNALTKKYVVSVKADANKKALDKFLHCNSACGNWELAVDKIDSKTEIILGELKRVIDLFWNRNGYSLFDHPYDLLREARVGPGANRLARGNDFYTKLFSSQLTCSNSSLYFWYKRYIQRFPDWLTAESIRDNHFGEPSIASSRLSFVPKNDEISRCICVEPSLNTYFQLGFEQVLLRRLRERFGIDLANQQQKNRDLARFGSITDSLSTIDLSSASDSISLKMLRWLLPSEFYAQLVKYRTPNVEIDGVGTVPLHMISTMGNGYTFPLQCIVFAGVVIACLRFRGLAAIPLDRGYMSSSENLWGVNGDDIVCPRLITSDVINVLSLLGFKVNDDKSFVEGPFRESCGSDFFHGVDIRGVYIKDLSSHASLYSVINQLVRFSARSDIWLGTLISFLRKKLGRKPLFVPRWESFSAGLHVPSWLDQVRRLPFCKERYAKSYLSLVPVPVSLSIEDGYIKTPSGCKSRIYNPNGLLISLLQGTINSSKIGVREDVVFWRKKRQYTSRWDSILFTSQSPDALLPWRELMARLLIKQRDIPPPDRTRQDFGLDWQRWEIAAYVLFND